MAAQPVQRPVGRPRRRKQAGRLEAILARQGFRYVGGVDEVGRGSLAGPLVAAGVVLDSGAVPDGLCDSKLLTPEERERLAEVVLAAAVSTAFVVVDPLDIDEDGLHVSNLAALARAARCLRPRPDYLISDCFELGDIEVPHLGLPKADVVSAAVAAASIVAKVKRDAFMDELDAAHPGYGFARHKGYSCQEHWAAIRALGPSPVHRRSFNGVASYQPTLQGMIEARGSLASGAPQAP